MNYPLISEYIESIKAAEDNFEKLNYLRPVLAADGQPVMTSGNFAVVFKMQDERDGKQYAVKCFTKEQQGREDAYRLIADELQKVKSPYIVPIKYLEKELFVDSKQTDETEFPILLMDWVEGKTLDKYLRETLEDQYALEMLAYRFSQLAQWLIPQPFAHGDLKPDNILVREDGTLVLVDYDGMYVPAMKGQKARELGSPDFRHPLRTEDDFDEHIDDFPIVTILLSLKAIAIQPDLLEKYGASDRFLLSESDYQNISQCKLLKDIFPSEDSELNVLQSLFMISLVTGNLSTASSNLFNLSRPKVPEYENLSTKVTKEDLENAWVDEYGVMYSSDRKRLLKAPELMETDEYSIKEGTIIICDSAFSVPDHEPDLRLCVITIPNGVTTIGKYAFHARAFLDDVDIPRSVLSIGECAFVHCTNLTSIKVEKSNSVYDSRDNCNAIIETVSNTLVVGCKNTVIPNTITSIGDNAFMGSRLNSMNIPNNIVSIGERAFYGCKMLTSVFIPRSVKSIDKYAFWGCDSLTSFTIPESVTSISENILGRNSSLSSIVVEKGNRIYDSRDNCNAIIETASSTLVVGCKETYIPESVISIGKYAFCGCRGLLSVVIPCSIKSIGMGAFAYCDLTSIKVKKGNNVYDSRDNCNAIIETASNTLVVGCKNSVIPNSITTVGNNAFLGCEGLSFVTIPYNVNYIDDDAFSGCYNLTSVTILSRVISIGRNPFDWCFRLASIKIPSGSRGNFEILPIFFKNKLKEV